tara:strand:+ start:550 stop:672 length:123 start_codon:yes stop_codon:yes gene_type:complete
LLANSTVPSGASGLSLRFQPVAIQPNGDLIIGSPTVVIYR